MTDVKLPLMQRFCNAIRINLPQRRALCFCWGAYIASDCGCVKQRIYGPVLLQPRDPLSPIGSGCPTGQCNLGSISGTDSDGLRTTLEFRFADRSNSNQLKEIHQ